MFCNKMEVNKIQNKVDIYRGVGVNYVFIGQLEIFYIDTEISIEMQFRPVAVIFIILWKWRADECRNFHCKITIAIFFEDLHISRLFHVICTTVQFGFNFVLWVDHFWIMARCEFINDSLPIELQRLQVEFYIDKSEIKCKICLKIQNTIITLCVVHTFSF